MKYIIWSYEDYKYLDDENGVALEFNTEEEAMKHLGANYIEENYLIENTFRQALPLTPDERNQYTK